MSDTKDALRCLDQFGPKLVRCKGDRLVAEGWSCPHCPSMNPSEECKAPKRTRNHDR